MLFCYQGGPLFVVVYLPSGSLFWVRSQRFIWESNTSRFHLGLQVGHWGFSMKWSAQSPGQLVTGSHLPFMVLICFLITCHTHMYLHLFVLMIGQLLCNNFVCMAIKIFLTWLDLKLCHSLHFCSPPLQHEFSHGLTEHLEMLQQKYTCDIVSKSHRGQCVKYVTFFQSYWPNDAIWHSLFVNINSHYAHKPKLMCCQLNLWEQSVVKV